jgi:general stress protein YciG
MKNRHKEATRPGRSGGFVWTGAVDEHGIPVELSAYDIERMDRPAIDQYRADREAEIDAKEAQRIEADDERRFADEYVRNGGERSKASAAFRADRDRRAAEEAGRAEEAALQAARRRVRQPL